MLSLVIAKREKKGVGEDDFKGMYLMHTYIPLATEVVQYHSILWVLETCIKHCQYCTAL